MTVPAHFVTAFSEDEELAEIFGSGEEARIYAASTLGEGENPEVPPKPYLVWNELPSTSFEEVEETSDAESRFYTFYVYDEMGVFENIDKALRRIRRMVKDMAPFRAGEDLTDDFCMQTKWQGFSGRFNDQTYDSSVRFGTARFDVNQ